METLGFAVLAHTGAEFEPRHLYRDRGRAEDRRVEYERAQTPALVMPIVPPLPASRVADVWAVADWSVAELRVLATRGAAELLAATLPAPPPAHLIRWNMPESYAAPGE